MGGWLKPPFWGILIYKKNIVQYDCLIGNMKNGGILQFMSNSSSVSK